MLFCNTIYSYMVCWVMEVYCLVTWFCYQLIAKPGNKTVAPQWPDQCLEFKGIYEKLWLLEFSQVSFSWGGGDIGGRVCQCTSLADIKSMVVAAWNIGICRAFLGTSSGGMSMWNPRCPQSVNVGYTVTYLKINSYHTGANGLLTDIKHWMRVEWEGMTSEPHLITPSKQQS